MATSGGADVEMMVAAAEEKLSAPEPPKELEKDAPPVKGPKIEKAVEMSLQDTTVNIMPSVTGNILMAPMDNGMQFLMAGARANTGVKTGRYVFEVKIIECSSPSDVGGPYPKNLLRMGFSISGSSLLLNSQETGICIDSEGYCGNAQVGQKLVQGNVVTCLLNLEKGHENFNTVSLFRDGLRICQPQPLPESLKGKTLFPTVAFKCMTLHMNFGPDLMVPLPFRVNMIGGASKIHAEQKASSPIKDCTVVYPVSLPDEGTFDWLDDFLEKNPGYVELSDRKIREWIENSAIWKRGAMTTSSNDKPEMGFGIAKLDDGYSVKKMIRTMCALQKRNYVVMEVKGNLIKEERAMNLDAFKGKGFKTQAIVLVGDPPISFQKKARELLLKEKQEASDKKFKAEQDAEKQKRQFAKRQKELEKIRKKAAKEREKAAKAKAKAIEEAKKKALAEKNGEKLPEEEEKKEEEEEPEEEEPEEEDEPEPVDEDPPKVSLTDEEKKLKFRPPVVPDLTPYALNMNFTKFSLPEENEEDFDEVKYDFIKDESKARDFLKEWIAMKKLTTRVEDIVPSAWFYETKKIWDKSVQEWHTALSKYKSTLAKKRADKAAREVKKRQVAAKAAAAKAKYEAAKEKAEKEGTDPPEAPPEEPVDLDDDEDEAIEPAVDFEGVDIFGVDDVSDIGEGMPLYKDFTNDDWTLLGLSFELHALSHAFKKDCNDPERLGIHVDHVDFYYTKYFKKALIPKNFGVETMRALVELVKDVVFVDDKSVLQNTIPDELETYQLFIKIVEEDRRYRNIRIDMGDDTASLKLSSAPAFGGYQHNRGEKRNWGGDNEKKDWGDKRDGGGKGGWGGGKGGWGGQWGGGFGGAGFGGKRQKGNKGWGK